MKAKELAELLKIITPTLAPHDLVPILSHYWLTGTHAMTFDDHLAMRVPCVTDVRLTIAKQVQELLSVSNPSKEVQWEEAKDGKITVRVGRNYAVLQTDAVERALKIFTMPNMVKEEILPAVRDNTKEFVAALKVSLLSTSNDPSLPEQCGVTILPEDDRLAIYSFNHDSLTQSFLKLGRTDFKKRIVVPAQFCEILSALSGGEVVVELTLNDQYCLARVDDIELYAKTLSVPRPTDIRRVVEDHYTPAAKKALVDVSDDLRELVARAMVIGEHDTEQEYTELEVKEGKLTFYTESSRGVVDDEIAFDGTDTSRVRIRSKLLGNGIDMFTKISITNEAVILSDGPRVYVISSAG